MFALLRAFISGQYRGLFQVVLWGAIFFVLAIVGYGFARLQISNQVRHDQDMELGRLAEIHENVLTALHMLQRDAVGVPCSRGFWRRCSALPISPMV